jgi:predicted Zn-dependent protease
VNQNFNELAEELIAERRWAEARALLERAIREMPSGWKPIQDGNVKQSVVGDVLSIAFWYMDEGLAYSGNPAVMQQADKSIKWVVGSYSKAWFLLAHIAVEERRLQDALFCIDQGLALEPDHPVLWSEKGLVLNTLKRPGEALECYRRAATMRGWAPVSQVARALRGQGAALIDLNRFDDAEKAFRKSLDLDPESEVARKELDYISQVRDRLAEEKQSVPWFVNALTNPPTDPMTVRLLKEVENLEFIAGPKTVGSDNYARIMDGFMKRGWAGFEETFDRIVPRSRPDYVEIKRNLLREPVFSPKAHGNMLRMAKVYASTPNPKEREAAISQELKKIRAERGNPDRLGEFPKQTAGLEAATRSGESRVNHVSSVERELRAYAAELRKRLPRIEAEGDYICEPLLNCEALGHGKGLPLVSWLYFNPFGPTMCGLFFTLIPDSDEGLLGYSMQSPFAREWAAFGVIPTEVAANSLPMILITLFAANGHESCRLIGGLPTSIFHRDNWQFEDYPAPDIDGDQARIMFRFAVKSISNVDLKTACNFLRHYNDDPWARAAAELDEGLLRAVVRVDDEQSGFNLGLYNEWFNLVTDPPHVKSERDNFGAAWQSALQARKRT